jgi:[acyl-carrier-protein] S-malonyltransferase
MKTAFVFPGQGSQYIGMAMDYLDAHAEVKQILADFDHKHNTNLLDVMRDGPEEALKETNYTQPAILFHSLAAYNALKHRLDIKPDFVAGHSLGEFSALVAAGVLSLEDAMHIVHKRGEFMIKANDGTPFAMAAILGLEASEVIAICADAESAGLVRAVNFNTLTQIVISGTEAGVQAAMELAKARGAKRALPLVVGGPFHTPLIAKASAWLAEEMQKVQFHPASCPVVSNLDALTSTDPAEIRSKLEKQIISPVLWVDCIRYMVSQGVTRFIEFGPNKVLSGMIKSIDKDVQVFNLDKLVEVDALLSAIM